MPRSRINEVYQNDPELEKLLCGKRIAFVGPAAHLTGTGSGVLIDSYDIVCRVNQSAAIPARLIKDYGARTDILIAGFNLSYLTLLKEQFDQESDFIRNLKYVVSPRNIADNDGNRVDLGFQKINKYNIPFHIIGDAYAEYNNRQARCETFTGLAGIITLLNYPVKELYVTGISFFNMGKLGKVYYDEYFDESVKCGAIEDNPEKIRTVVAHRGGIQPQIDYFIKLLKQYPKLLTIDSYLKEKLHSSLEPRVMSHESSKAWKFEIAITDYCNLNCHFCSQATPLQKNKKTMSMVDIEKIGGNVKPWEFEVIKISGGEPTLHPQFAEICKKLRVLFQAGRLELATNGFRLEKFKDCLHVFDGIDLGHYPGKNDEVVHRFRQLQIPNINILVKRDSIEMMDVYEEKNLNKEQIYEHCCYAKYRKIVQERIFPCCVIFGQAIRQNIDINQVSVPFDKNWRENLAKINLENHCRRCFVDVEAPSRKNGRLAVVSTGSSIQQSSIFSKSRAITIFAAPKEFRGKDAVRQRNALKSWTLLQPTPEIILFGDDDGVPEEAKKFGLRHIADVQCNEFGTPLVNDLFEKAQKAASNDILAYVNTDIILMNDFPLAAEKTAQQFDEFLMVGQRWDVPISQLIDFTNPQWKKWILQQIAEKGTLHAVTGIDYFVFRKHFWKNIPPFALGRTAWDNWLVYNALAKQKPLIDTTEVVIAVHQNHDYAHILGSPPDKWEGPECRQNVALAGPQCTSKGFISSALWKLTPKGVSLKPVDMLEKCKVTGREIDCQREIILCETTKMSPAVFAKNPKNIQEQTPKFSFVMIVLNGMPFIEYSLKSVYYFAHEIIIVEGAVKDCMFAANPDGSSKDGTVEFIKSFPDPENKIRFIQGKWPEKCEMQNEALKHVTGNYVWLIDSDEVYKREDLEKIKEIIKADPTVTQVDFIPDNFWKGLDYIFVSDKFYEEPHHYRRLFKYKPGAVFTSHRPPTMFWPNSSLSTEQMNLIDGLQTRQRGIILYHYSYVLERQVAQKMEYYRRRDLKTNCWSIDRDTWYNECFLRWNEQNRKQIENKYPVWLGDKDSHTEPFKGTHPEVMIEYARTHDRNGGAYPRPPVMQNLIDATDELKNRFPNEHLEMIETGTIRTFHAAGSSTYSISEALGSQGRLTSVDISPDSIRISKNFCWNAPNIEWIQSDSITYLAKLKDKKFHFAFLDSVNQKDFIFEEFRLMIPMMLENSILIIDDSGITNDGCSIDNGVPAQKGHEVWCFLKSCGAKFNIFQVPNFPGTQLKIGLGKENLKVIKNKLRQYDEDRFIPESSNLPANTQSGRKLQAEPIIHFVYSGDPYDDNAIRTPRTITNKLFRFLKQRAEVKYYDWADKTSKVDVKLNDIILGHPNPEEGTIIRRLFEKPCATKYLIWPFHTRIPEINRYVKDVANVADKLFVISGPHWIETIDQTEYACWKEKIVRLDNAIDAEIFLLLKKKFNPVSKRGLFVFGRTGLEKGTVQLFKLLCKTDYPMVVAGDYSHEDLQIIKNRPNTHILGRIDWRDPQTTTFILNNCDFFVNMSVSDASPTTLLESMALGLIPVTTPQCGYYYDSFLLLSLSQQEHNLQILHQAQQLSDDKLRELQAQNRRIIEREHSWEKFCQTVWQNIKPTKKLTSKVGPRQNDEEYVTYNFNDGKNKKRVLIVRSDSIGDFVIFGGSLPYYRKIYPNAQITIVVSESVAKLAEACPFIDEIITFNREKILSQPNYAAEFISYVRDKQFDVAICPAFSRDKVSEFIAINSGAVEKITCSGDTANLPADIIKANNAHYTKIVPMSEGIALETFRNEEFLKGLDVELDGPYGPTVWVTQADREVAEQLLNRRGIKEPIVIIPFAQLDIRNWPVKNWAKLISMYPDVPVIICGIAKDKPVAEKIISLANHPNIHNLCGLTTVRQLAALIAKSRLSISSESGAAHIAAAANRPHVVLIGGGHFGRFMPYSSQTKLVYNKMDCYNCNWQCKYGQDISCIATISVDMVERAVNEVFGTIRSVPVFDNSKVTIQAKKDIADKSDFLVSAIVSTYNSEKFIRGCLDDLIDQSLFKKGQLEIVVVNSGSQQNEEAIFKEFQQKYDNIKYIKTEERETVYQAWNRGIKVASGKYITNANTDDRHCPEMFEKLASQLDRNKNIAAVYSHFYITEVENQTWETKTPESLSTWHPPYSREELLKRYFLGPQPMWRKSLHDEYGYFDGTFKVAGDHEFFLRVSQTHDFLLVPELLGLYLSSYDSVERTAGTLDEENVRIWRLYKKDKCKIVRRPFRPDEKQVQPVHIGSTQKLEPKVSIVTACYNAEKFLPECLDSIMNQTMKDWELFLLDDGSTDGTRNIIEKYAGKDPRIRPYYSDNNTGPDVRRNFAIRQANSNFIVIHDADDIMCPAKLEMLYHEIAGDKRLGAVGAFYRTFIDEFRGLQYTDETKLPLEHDDIVARFSSWLHGMSQGSSIIRKDLLEAVGFYDEIPFCSDAFLFAKMAEYSKHCSNVRFKNVPQYLTLLRIHSSSQSRLLPYFDPRGRQYRYKQYCENKLEKIRQKLECWPHMDIKTELKNCVCSDFIEKYGHLFTQWESELFDYNVFFGRMGWVVRLFNDRRYVTCIAAFEDIETVEYEIVKRFKNYDLLRAMAYFAIDMKQQSLECLNREIKNHDSPAARQFISDYFQCQLKTDVQNWCVKNGKLYDLRIIGLEDESATRQKDNAVSYRHASAKQAHSSRNFSCGQVEPLVSAIVSTYNSERFIRGCLDDLIGQSLFKKGQLEIVVVNSGSQQNEEAIFKEFQQKYDNIKYIKTEERETVYQAWNRGIKVASGKYITNANTDDRHRQDALQVMADTLLANPDIALIYGDQICTDTPDDTFAGHHGTEMTRRPDYNRERLLFGCCVGSQPMWRKSLHSEFGYFDDTLSCAGDWDFWLRVSSKYNFKRIPEFLGLYYYNENGIEHSRKIHSLYERYIVGKRYGNPYISVIPLYTSKDNPLVSVIMAAYNAAEHIAEAIESVLIQNYRNFELIVVDDGSTDNTSDIVAGFKDDKIRCFYKENAGPASARNLGITKSQGLFLIHLDSDDMITPDFITKHLQEFERHPGADLVYCDDCLIEENSKPIRVIERPEYKDRRLLIRDLFHCGFPAVPFRTCIRRSVFDKIGFFDEGLLIAEDYDMMRRFVKHGLKIHHLKGALYLRRMTSDSLSRNYSTQKAKCHFDVIKRYIDTFTYDELFPDVAWDQIAPEMRQLHAKCLTAGTYLAIGQEYVKTNAPEYSRIAFDLVRSELNDCVKMDPENQDLRQLLQKSKLIRAKYTEAPQQVVS